jgi:clan AA aspartic protease
MIRGIVRGNEAYIPLTVLGARGRKLPIDAIVDTGYTSSLSLPRKSIEQLRLKWYGVGRAILADGGMCVFNVFEAIVVWDKKPLRIYVDEAESEALIGMELMRGFELNVQVQPRGQVTLTKLS